MQADSNGALRVHIYFNCYSHYLCPSSSLATSPSHPLPSSGECGGNVRGKKIEEDCVSLKGHTLPQWS